MGETERIKLLKLELLSEYAWGFFCMPSLCGRSLQECTHIPLSSRIFLAKIVQTLQTAK